MIVFVPVVFEAPIAAVADEEEVLTSVSVCGAEPERR